MFELLAAEPQGLTVSEISERLGLARSSAHGLVQTLYSRGYLMENGGRRFSPRRPSDPTRPQRRRPARAPRRGARPARAARGRHARHGAARRPRQGRPPVRRQGDQRCARRAHRPACELPSGRCTARVSERRCSPRSTTSSVLEVVAVTGLERATEFSIGDRDELLSDLARTRERWYSLDQQEAVLGVWCVGAPVATTPAVRSPPSASRRSRTSSTRSERDRAWPRQRLRSRGPWAGRVTRPRSTYRWRASTSSRSGTGAADMATRS